MKTKSTVWVLCFYEDHLGQLGFDWLPWHPLPERHAK